MLILIPTYGRVEKQTTYDFLCDSLKEDTLLIVSRDEDAPHRDRGRKTLLCPVQGKGTALVRNWMMEWCYKNDYKKVIMMDDDLTLQKRGKDLRCIGTPTDEQQREMFYWMWKQLNKYLHCSMTERNAAWADADSFRIATKGIQCVGYNIKRIVEDTDCRFNRGVPDWFFIEDYHLTLQLFEAGFPNIVSRDYRVNYGPSNAKGGCSSFRTPEKLKEAAELLAKLHPGIVTAVKKDTKLWGGERWNVKVMWKKAYEMSKNKAPVGKTEAISLFD